MRFSAATALALLPALLSSAAAKPLSSVPTPEDVVGGGRPEIERQHVRLTRTAAEPSQHHKRADLGEVARFPDGQPQPQRGEKGGTFFHPSNTAIDFQNHDNVAPPPTDAGVVENLKWPFSLSHTRIIKGGWVREQTVTDLPPSKDISAAELRLNPGSIRELHWHSVSEWAYVLAGSGQISAVDQDGKNFISDVHTGDVWYFPQGIGHSIQASDEGLEFVVLFAGGDQDSRGFTFMLDDWVAHTPKEILAQNFGVNTSVFDHVPSPNPYLFPGSSPGSVDQEKVESPEGEVPNTYFYSLSTAEATSAPGGSVKIVDSKNFPISDDFAAALVTINPGALRELHWHPNKDEWFYVVSGNARVTAFSGQAAARTFDLTVGDTAVWPTNFGHYIQNIGDEPLVVLEVFKDAVYQDISLTQWLALTPHEVVAANLNISKEAVDGFAKKKQLIIT